VIRLFDVVSPNDASLAIERVEAIGRTDVCGSSRFAEPAERRSRFMKATEFDTKFDAGEDVSGDVDWSKARRPNLTLRRVTIDITRPLSWPPTASAASRRCPTVWRWA